MHIHTYIYTYIYDEHGIYKLMLVCQHKFVRVMVPHVNLSVAVVDVWRQRSLILLDVA